MTVHVPPSDPQLVEEAGGIVCDADGQPWEPGATGFVAATPAIHAQLLESLATARHHPVY